MLDQGVPACSLFAGYWLGTEPDDFARCEQFRRRLGLAHLVGAVDSTRSDAAAGAGGQLALFGDPQ